MFDLLKNKIAEIEEVCTKLGTGIDYGDLSEEERWKYDYREMVMAFALMETEWLDAAKLSKLILDTTEDPHKRCLYGYSIM